MLDAMKQAGASTKTIEYFAELMRKFCSLEYALETLEAPSASAAFVKQTFDVIKKKVTYPLVAGVFTFGRVN
jgi:hypothetical protein